MKNIAEVGSCNKFLLHDRAGSSPEWRNDRQPLKPLTKIPNPNHEPPNLKREERAIGASVLVLSLVLGVWDLVL
jgi:hypothetical protein